LVTSGVQAQEGLSLPSSFWGTVTAAGGAVPAGVEVTAWIDDRQAATTHTQLYEGQTVYSLDVRADDPDTTAVEGGQENGPVLFRVGGQTAGQQGVWRSGVNQRLDLSTEGTIPVVGISQLAGEDAAGEPAEQSSAPVGVLPWLGVIVLIALIAFALARWRRHGSQPEE